MLRKKINRSKRNEKLDPPFLDGFDEVTPIRHGLGDFRTPHPGPYPDNLPGSRPDDPQQEWDNSRASPEELRHLEYRYSHYFYISFLLLASVLRYH